MHIECYEIYLCELLSKIKVIDNKFDNLIYVIDIFNILTCYSCIFQVLTSVNKWDMNNDKQFSPKFSLYPHQTEYGNTM